MTIRILKTQKELENGNILHREVLFVNDIIVESAYCYSSGSRAICRIDDDEDVSVIYDIPISEIISSFTEITFPLVEKIGKNIYYAAFRMGKNPDEKLPDENFLDFEFYVNYVEWNKPWTILEYSNAVQSIAERINGKETFVRYFHGADDGLLTGFGVRFPIVSSAKIVIDVINEFASIVEEIEQKAEELLIDEVNKNSLTLVFDFPPSIKTACEQYLLYFVQFLQDLDIDAEADITHSMNQVLFSVTPKNKEEALDKIREALAAYLQIPNSEIPISNSSDISLLQLQSNQFHLKSQMALSAAEMKYKDAIIDQLEISNFHLKQIIMAQSNSANIVNPIKDKKDEEVMGGTLSITKLKLNGLEVNLPEIYRRLKRKIRLDK